MEIEKIIQIFKEAILNKYFLYTIMILGIYIIIKHKKDYKLYLYDCMVLNQKPKPIGFTINSLFSYAQISVIAAIVFIGYGTYKNKEIFMKESKTYTIKNTKYKKQNKPHQIKYKIKETETKQNKNNKYEFKEINKLVMINKKPKTYKKTKKLKKLSEKEIAEIKLKKELKAAIEAVK